jgi:hypothetical protein
MFHLARLITLAAFSAEMKPRQRRLFLHVKTISLCAAGDAGARAWPARTFYKCLIFNGSISAGAHCRQNDPSVKLFH